MSKKPKSTSNPLPDNVVSLELFRAKKAARAEAMECYAAGSKLLGMPPPSKQMLDWLNQYSDL
jgi:hypothetical protein